MKALQFAAHLFIATATISAGTSEATAQSLALPRGDFNATIAWLTVNTESPELYRGADDWNNSFFAGIGAGWHWTEHHKTEIDFGAGTKARAYYAQPVAIDGRQLFVSTESTLQRRTLGISQQYQFLHNAWFHPHVAVGANISWERISDHVHPIVVYDDVNRTGRIIEPSRIVGPRTEVRTRPFVAAGFKGYMSRQAFFRSDLRVAFRDGVDDVLLRIGFGVDF